MRKTKANFKASMIKRVLGKTTKKLELVCPFKHITPSDIRSGHLNKMHSCRDSNGMRHVVNFLRYN